MIRWGSLYREKRKRNDENVTSSNNIPMDRKIPAQSSLYISIISCPDLKFCPDLFGVLKSRSYFVPTVETAQLSLSAIRI